MSAKNKSKMLELVELKDEQETLDSYLDIWNQIPSFKDIKANMENAKRIFIFSFSAFIFFVSYVSTVNLFYSLGLGVAILLSLVFLFRERFFSLQGRKFSRSSFRKITPLKELRFWRTNEAKKCIVITSVRDAVHIGLCGFKVSIIPENIHPPEKQFIKGLDAIKTTFTYQVVQVPFISPLSENLNRLKSQEVNNSKHSKRTEIFFFSYFTINGLLTKSKLSYLLEMTNEKAKIFTTGFNSNFPHFKISQLEGKQLAQSLRVFLLKGKYRVEEKEHEPSKKPARNYNGSFKTIIMGSLMLYISLALAMLEVSYPIILLVNLTIVFFVLFLFNRNILIYLGGMRNSSLKQINPFSDCEFYASSLFPDSIFILLGRKLFVGMKSFGLFNASPPLLNNKGYFLGQIDKFYRAIIDQNVPFSYEVGCSPLSPFVFNNLYSRFLNDRSRKGFLDLRTTQDKQEWLEMRGGMWRTSFTLSIFSYLQVVEPNFEHLVQLEKELESNYRTARIAFEINLPKFYLRDLKSNSLNSCLLFNLTKNKFFNITGTRLPLLVLQGSELVSLIDVVDELKRCVTTKIAAEFNAPTKLENFVNIGYTINPENLNLEIPAGFTYDQIKHLLIVNGASHSRDLFLLKTIVELAKSKVPSIVFDFTGNYSKLIRYLKGSQFENDFLYFKLGNSFNLDLMNSGIPYDKNNAEFLNYVFDVIGISYKLEQRAIDTLKNSILRNPSLDISMLSLEYQSQQTWEKSPALDSFFALFSDLAQQTSFFFDSSKKTSNEITVRDFLCDRNTIIIDLSTLFELKHKEFATFLIVSKMIHYTKYNDDYCKKILVIPNIDLFFDEKYLDKGSNYGKIDKFLAPLFGTKFGIIATANEIRYLHPNIFNFFSNFVAFKTTDSRDISVIKNKMHLQELQGMGYFSSKRQNTYQIDYLMNMRDREFVMKRSDIDQPFPAVIKKSKLSKLMPPTISFIDKYMEERGYNLKLLEKRAIDHTKNTLFEKDLGTYILFLEEIIKFLDVFKKMDKVAIYEAKVKEALLQFIYDKASQAVSRNKQKILKIRDEVFRVLVKQGYLTESHPKTAGGSESIRVSYQVGEQYKKALDDYYAAERERQKEVKTEVIQKETQNTTSDVNRKEKQKISDEILFREALIHNTFVPYLKRLLQIQSAINSGNFSAALQLERRALSDFAIDYYSRCIRKESQAEPLKDVKVAVEYLTKNKKIDFDKDPLLEIVKCEKEGSENVENITNSFYNVLSQLYDCIKKISES